MDNIDQGDSKIIRDLRSFISLLEQSRELIRINTEVDCKYEIGEKTRGSNTPGLKHPAYLFESIKDYPGWRVFSNGLSSYSKMAIALGLDPSTLFHHVVRIAKQRLLHPIQPAIAKDSPAQASILIGEEVDLMRIPVPWWSRADGGRYIGTWHLNITKDPDTCARNVGIYRMQLLGPRKTSISFSKKSHIAVHLAKAESRNKPLEMAVAIGVPETHIMAAAAAPPYGADEFAVAGGLGQRSVELTKCETIDLEVPSSAEIVLEGKILPKIRIKEGPFLDYSGVPKSDPTACIFEVTSMLHRDNPIFRGAAIGYTGAEDHLLFSLLSRANHLDFHGSGIRQSIQNFMLKKGLFSAFQLVGLFGHHVKKRLERQNIQAAV